MKKFFSRFLFFFFSLEASILACPEMHGSLEISNQAAVFLKGVDVGVAYLTIVQTTETADKLIAAKIKTDTKAPKDFTPRAVGLFSSSDKKQPYVEFHDHISAPENPNVLTMKQIKGGIVIPGSIKDSDGKRIQSTPVKFEKNGKHLMLYNFPKAARNGNKLELILTFEKAGDIAITFPVNTTSSDDNAKACPHHQH